MFCFTAVVRDTVSIELVSFCNFCQFSYCEISRDKGHGTRGVVEVWIVGLYTDFKTWVELIYVRLYGGSH